ncbi:TIGR03032 family protein [Woeseiaceae bacterium]|nr:TIGR03032 family protein [Woeseiaceae bacterium]
MKRNIPFTTKQDINRLSKEKKIIFFGAGNIAEKTTRIIPQNKLHAIVDNSTNLSGEVQFGVKVYPPEFLETEQGKGCLVIITTTSFSDVSGQLERLGFIPSVDFIVSPVLNDLRIIDELESIETSLMFSSGAPRQNTSLYGGGIYQLSVNGDQWKHEKKIDGNCYGITKYKENYVALDTDRGIIEFDKNFKIIRQAKLPSGSRAHGIDFSDEKQIFFVNCSYLDTILFINTDFEIIDEISISDKQKKYGKPAHHSNDCCVWGDSLFVSMFSETGNWKLDVFDGAILEFDIVTRKLVGAVVRDLWMPHNIKVIDGSLTLLDSLKGHLLTNNMQVSGDFPAFTRGLDYDGQYYYIGQSRNRNYSKNLGLSKNISIDAGIIVFDVQTKASRFLQLPPKLSEIHSIMLL